MDRTVLITGVDGFTGRHLAPHLAAKGYEVHGLVRSLGGTLINGVQGIYECDLLDQVRLQSVIANVRPQKIVHLAAVAFVAHDNVFEMYETNILGTRSLLEACAQPMSPSTSVLVVSSANVYGNASADALREDAPICPENDYGVTKSAAENLANIYSSRIPTIIVRPFNYTGVGQSRKFLIPKIINHIKCREKSIELGNLDVARDISDVRSIVDIYERLLASSTAIGQTFNVCSGTAVALQEIVDMALSLAGHNMEIRVNPAFVRANEVRLLCGSKDKLESFVGPIDAPSLSETLRWMLDS